MRQILAIALLSGAVLVAAATAEPIALSQDGPRAVELAFRADPRLGERVGRADGVVDEDGKRFFLTGLDVMSPLVIQVLAKDPGKPIEVSLHRYVWEEAQLEARTDAEGHWGYTGRVHDELGIELRAAERAGFYVLAWAGEAIAPAFGTNAFVTLQPEQAARRAGGSAPNRWLVGLVGLLAVAVVVLMFRLKRGRGAAAVLLLLAAAPPRAAAQPDDFEIRLALAETRIESIDSNHRARFLSLQSQLDGVQDQIGGIYDEIDGVSSDVSGLQDDVDGLRDEVDGLEGEIDQVKDESLRTRDDLEVLRADVYETQDGLQAGLDMVIDLITGFADQLEEIDSRDDTRLDQLQAELRSNASSLNSLIRALTLRVTALETLVAEDRVAEPNPRHARTDPMPSSCVANRSCRQCFLNANTKLVNRLLAFEQLRIIFDAQMAYSERMVEFGDARSGFHQLEQARWYEIKQQIKQSERQFYGAALGKWNEMTEDLRLILRMYDDCERRYGGIDNWYDRYGYLYWISIRAAYEPKR